MVLDDKQLATIGIEGEHVQRGESHLSRGGPRSIQHPIIIADPEFPEKTRHRRFSAKYKLRILDEANRCIRPGELGALLRREGLYSFHLTCWRRQRREGPIQGITPRKRGPKVQAKNPLTQRVLELEREISSFPKRSEE